MHAASVQSQMADSFIESLLGQAQQSQTDLAMKLARISLATSLQSPSGTSDASGAGSRVDLVA
jgi:hypothetical protein